MPVEGDRLAVLGEKGVLCSIEIGERLSIGRGFSNDLQLPEPEVSRQHCLIERRGSELFIRDLDSSNGTFINGRRISETVLSSGDTIHLGTTELAFERGKTENQENQELAREIPVHPIVPGDVYQMEGVTNFYYDGLTPDSFQKTLKRLSTLFEIENIINTSRDSASLMHAVLEQIVRIITADRYQLYLKNEKTAKLEPVAVYPEQNVEEGEIPEISQTILYTVLREGTSILSADTSHDERFSGARSVILYEISSVMCVPLRSHEKILGVINVVSLDPAHLFTREDLNFLTAIGISAGIAVENTNLYENLKRLFRSTVESLVAVLEANDPYTGGHSIRVAAYVKELALRLNLSPGEVEKVELAAFLHDIGKVGVPSHVLNKPAHFDRKEFDVIREHPVIGYEVLSKIEGMEEIAQVVRHHHERYDGQGYPDGLSGNEIPLGSRILCVADTFDALVTDRIYSKGRPILEALDEISHHSGTQFDPQVVDVLEQYVGKEKNDLMRMSH
jgi:putative nucleotidyltransferase with HDIG domain